VRSRALIAQAIGMSAETLPTDAALGSVEAWDSLGHMRLLLAIEEALQRELTTEEAAGVMSLADVERLLARS
jgi:acyl carrier protein